VDSADIQRFDLEEVKPGEKFVIKVKKLKLSKKITRFPRV
jgi:hypothetical protein